ncbi:hypothetical protein D3C71_2106930 [compost metagenome]
MVSGANWLAWNDTRISALSFSRGVAAALSAVTVSSRSCLRRLRTVSISNCSLLPK